MSYPKKKHGLPLLAFTSRLVTRGLPHFFSLNAWSLYSGLLLSLVILVRRCNCNATTWSWWCLYIEYDFLPQGREVAARLVMSRMQSEGFNIKTYPNSSPCHHTMRVRAHTDFRNTGRDKHSTTFHIVMELPGTRSLGTQHYIIVK